MASNQGSGSSKAISWEVYEPYKGQVNETSKRTNWEAIRERASQVNNGQPCKFLAHETSGANSMARLLEFQDGTCWVARVQMAKADPTTSRKLQIELDTVMLLKDRTKAPVAQVFAYEIDDNNPAGVPYTLFELIPGNHGYGMIKEKYPELPSGRIPSQFRQESYRTMAAAHVQIASARFDKIGAVTRAADGTFTVGPIPGIGGPFDTAAEYIQALAEEALAFPLVSDRERDVLPAEIRDEVMRGFDEFPDRLYDMADAGAHFTREGPFPVRHPELLLHNTLYDEGFRVLGIIDWAGATTVPWELVDIPRSISSFPRFFWLPDQFDEAGQLKDEDVLAHWAEERAYAAMVREAEQDAHTDHKLSDMLLDLDAQDFAQTIAAFQTGKYGRYGQAMDYFEEKYEA